MRPLITHHSNTAIIASSGLIVVATNADYISTTMTTSLDDWIELTPVPLWPIKTVNACVVLNIAVGVITVFTVVPV